MTDDYNRGFQAGRKQGRKDIFVRLHDVIIKRFPYLGFALNEILQATLSEIERGDRDV